MTVGAEGRPRSAGWSALAVAVGVVLAGTSCTFDASTSPTDPAGVAATAAAELGTGAIPVGDELAIRATISTLNDAAAGPVAEQQDALRTVVAPDAAAALDNCPPATTTLRFEPVWAGLRPDPAVQEQDGAGYALPTRIRAFTADRITATDLTTLQFTVRSGAAYVTPVCAG